MRKNNESRDTLCSSDQCRTVKLRLPAAAKRSGVCWEEGMGDGGVLVLQDVGTMKSLHWRCEMWFDCVKRKRSVKFLSSATAPCTFAAALSFQACLRVFRMYISYVCVINVYVWRCADMYVCI